MERATMELHSSFKPTASIVSDGEDGGDHVDLEKLDLPEETVVPVLHCHKTRPDPKSMPARQYLDMMVAPVLLHGLQALARERPSDPITFLASYLLKNRSRCEEVELEHTLKNN